MKPSKASLTIGDALDIASKSDAKKLKTIDGTFSLFSFKHTSIFN